MNTHRSHFSTRASFFGNSRSRKHVLEEVVQANPSWFNEQGLMVNLKGPDFLVSIPFTNPSANRASGFYVADRNHDRLRGHQFQNHHTGQVPLKFSISNNRIHQELQDNRLAIIYPNGQVRIFDENKNLSEVWEPFFKFNSLTGKMHKTWRRVSWWSMNRAQAEETFIPATFAEYFNALSKEMQATLHALGFEEDMEQEFEDQESDPWNWVYELAQQVTDAQHYELENSPEPWLMMEVDVSAAELWNSTLVVMRRWVDDNRGISGKFISQAMPLTHSAKIHSMKMVVEAVKNLRDNAVKRAAEAA